MEVKSKFSYVPIVRNGTVEDMKKLMETNFNINNIGLVNDEMRNINGYDTPLNEAILSKNEEVAIYLVRIGADLHLLNKNGYAPIHLAFHNGLMDLINVILSRDESLSLLKDFNNLNYLDYINFDVRNEKNLTKVKKIV